MDTKISTDLIEVLKRLENLSVEELLTVQEDVRQKLHIPDSPKVTVNPTDNGVIIPGAYRASKEEIEAELAEILTTEELAEMEGFDLDSLQLPPGAKTSTQLISEDREDRF